MGSARRQLHADLQLASTRPSVWGHWHAQNIFLPSPPSRLIFLDAELSPLPRDELSSQASSDSLQVLSPPVRQSGTPPGFSSLTLVVQGISRANLRKSCCGESVSLKTCSRSTTTRALGPRVGIPRAAYSGNRSRCRVPHLCPTRRVQASLGYPQPLHYHRASSQTVLPRQTRRPMSSRFTLRLT